jgi:hypothetical protein
VLESEKEKSDFSSARAGTIRLSRRPDKKNCFIFFIVTSVRNAAILTKSFEKGLERFKNEESF